MKKIIILSTVLVVCSFATIFWWERPTTDIRTWMLILFLEGISQAIIELSIKYKKQIQ